jgi:hypothetical protein
MDETDLLKRITVNPAIFGGKPIIRGRALGCRACPGDVGGAGRGGRVAAIKTKPGNL